jgi:hypothetical protein
MLSWYTSKFYYPPASAGEEAEMHRLIFSIMAAVLLMRSTAPSHPSLAESASVEPIFLRDSPTCQFLGFAGGLDFKVAGSGLVTVETPSGTLSFETDGYWVRWTADFGVRGVIVEGSPNALHYRYHPPKPAYADQGLHAPLLEDGSLPPLRRLSFCFEDPLPAGSAAPGGSQP